MIALLSLLSDAALASEPGLTPDGRAIFNVSILRQPGQEDVEISFAPKLDPIDERSLVASLKTARGLFDRLPPGISYVFKFMPGEIMPACYRSDEQVPAGVRDEFIQRFLPAVLTSFSSFRQQLEDMLNKLPDVDDFTTQLRLAYQAWQSNAVGLRYMDKIDLLKPFKWDICGACGHTLSFHQGLEALAQEGLGVDIDSSRGFDGLFAALHLLDGVKDRMKQLVESEEDSDLYKVDLDVGCSSPFFQLGARIMAMAARALLPRIEEECWESFHSNYSQALRTVEMWRETDNAHVNAESAE